ARHLAAERTQDLFDLAREATGSDLRRQAAAIQVLHEGLQARGAKSSDYLSSWAATAAQALIESNNVDDVREAIGLARSMKLDPLIEPVQQIAIAERKELESLRADAISMLAEVRPDQSLPLLSALLGNAAEPLPLRQHVASALGQRPTAEVHDTLLRYLRTAPDELALHLAAALAGSAEGAENLRADGGDGKASPRPLQHAILHPRPTPTPI